ncbi:MAG: hypothetical protein UU37_C0001G0033 [Candidatus Gottesmanbacteria bacterium GW2011_GWA2_41_12]|uniref:Glycosyltransferase RgtA/B/C/D-like domain-containing protein n=2 Tax=Candidatus Gottesmaniibacteriota TaxID=1752720 RepID=A0A0G0UIJ7_9BACT|nr:MAG: hypothetical protein UT63_C0005G0010 [Candidatus Gottesmanbacteria bacterium GW2011_GWC2_39_8]KKR88614.1 MAG: hypothetical protein UU37_C0001G0033 [Candidatus Gottesmanbacteria bacterium GW2011_GWA2_41_12]
MNFSNFLTAHTPLFYLLQPLWRDEAFSVFVANPKDITTVLSQISNDFNPPLYYLILHFVIRTFGEGEVILRLFSFIFHLGTSTLTYILFKKLFNKKTAVFAFIFTLLNPMLIYYGFELRMYSLYAFLAMASMVSFLLKKRGLFILTSVLGLYTHSFFLLVLAGQFFYYAIRRKINKRTLTPFVLIFLLYIPWISTLIRQFGEAKVNWIFPVDLQLVKSVLGNLFTGYEGTPWYLWKITFYLSLIILAISIFQAKKARKGRILPSIYILIILPLVLIYSIARQPIFVNRYLIFVTVAEVITIIWFIADMKNGKLKSASMILTIMSVFLFNLWFADKHPKNNYRSMMANIWKNSSGKGLIMTDSISFFESYYYYPDRNKVFLYNPQKVTLPRYLGTSAIPNDKMINKLPASDEIYLIHGDGTYDKK